MKTDDLITLLAADAATTSPRPSAQLMQWLPPAILAASILVLAGLGVRPDLADASVFSPIMAKLLFGTVLAGFAGFAALHLSRPDASAGRPVALAGAAAALLLAIILLRDLGWLQGASATWADILPCVTLIPLIATLPLAAFLLAMRAGAVTQPGPAGAMAGFASAGLVMIAYGLHCTQDSPLFVGLWYSVAATITAMIGAFTARRVLVW